MLVTASNSGTAKVFVLPDLQSCLSLLPVTTVAHFPSPERALMLRSRQTLSLAQIQHEALTRHAVKARLTSHTPMLHRIRNHSCTQAPAQTHALHLRAPAQVFILMLAPTSWSYLLFLACALSLLRSNFLLLAARLRLTPWYSSFHLLYNFIMPCSDSKGSWSHRTAGTGRSRPADPMTSRHLPRRAGWRTSPVSAQPLHLWQQGCESHLATTSHHPQLAPPTSAVGQRLTKASAIDPTNGSRSW